MNILQKLRNGALRIFGNIKIFPYPMFVLYDPGSYLIKGDEMRELMSKIQAGDIVIRGFNNYIDGYFIPGFFSHAGQYLGKVSKEDLQKVDPDVKQNLIVEGEQIVIHSMSRGVFMEDVLNFCRCDYMVVLRRNPNVETPEQQNYSFTDVLTKAATYLGRPYDFDFNFSDYHNLSCTELVYACNEKVMPAYNVSVKKRRVMCFTKPMIIPDDFVNEKFTLVWKSNSISDKQLQKIYKGNRS
jgi:hypothetical protein